MLLWKFFLPGGIGRLGSRRDTPTTGRGTRRTARGPRPADRASTRSIATTATRTSPDAWAQWTPNGLSGFVPGGRYYVQVNWGTWDTHEHCHASAELKSAWSPLLFVDQWKPGALHFSLPPDGRVNVILHYSNPQYVHSTGWVATDSNRWGRVAIVYDAGAGLLRFCLSAGRSRARRRPSARWPRTTAPATGRRP